MEHMGYAALYQIWSFAGNIHIGSLSMSVNFFQDPAVLMDLSLKIQEVNV